MQWNQINRGRWQKVRAQALARDNHTCRINLPGCLTAATEVDHIIDLRYGGPAYDLNNLRATCPPCHRTVTHHTPPNPRSTPEHW